MWNQERQPGRIVWQMWVPYKMCDTWQILRNFESEEFLAQASWPFLLRYCVAKWLLFYCSYVGGLPNTELEKRSLRKRLEIVCLPSFGGREMWQHVWREAKGIFWDGKDQFSFYSKMKRTDFGSGKEASKRALEETKQKIKTSCPLRDVL